VFFPQTRHITIPAAIARAQLGSLLIRIAHRGTRFVITERGRPTAVLLGADAFDDLVEELDPVFQRSLKVAAGEYRAGRAISLKDSLA
jgi:prevent-host-death family protein